MIKREFECLFGRYKSYLHIVIFNEGKRSREEGEKNKREKDKEIKSRKKLFNKNKRIFLIEKRRRFGSWFLAINVYEQIQPAMST